MNFMVMCMVSHVKMCLESDKKQTKLEVDVDYVHLCLHTSYHCCNALHTNMHNHSGTVSNLLAYW